MDRPQMPDSPLVDIRSGSEGESSSYSSSSSEQLETNPPQRVPTPVSILGTPTDLEFKSDEEEEEAAAAPLPQPVDTPAATRQGGRGKGKGKARVETPAARTARQTREVAEARAKKEAAEADAKRLKDEELERRIEDATRRIGDANTAFAAKQAAEAEAKRQQDLTDAQQRQEREAKEAVEDEQTWARGDTELIDVPFEGGIPDFEDGGAATSGAVPFSSSSTLGDPKPATPSPFFAPPSTGFEDIAPTPADFGDFGAGSGFGDSGFEPASSKKKKKKEKKAPTLPPAPRPAPAPLVDTRAVFVSPTKTTVYPALPRTTFTNEEWRAYERYQARAASRRGRPAAPGAAPSSSSLPVVEDTRAKIIRILVKLPTRMAMELIVNFRLNQTQASISSVADHIVTTNRVRGFTNLLDEQNLISKEEAAELNR